jgi:hypothetical protein
MRGGDLSNEGAGTVLVNLESVITRTPTVEKFLWVIPRIGEQAEYDVLALSQMHRFSANASTPIQFEAFMLEATTEDTEKASDYLDQLGLNPFRWITPYASLHSFMRALPYRRNIFGVMDVPQRALQYGSYYVDVNQIYGSR